MVHAATQRVALAAVSALGCPVDIGFVFPPRPGELRGRGVWTGRNLGPSDIAALLPRAAAANAQGGAIYFRLGPSCREAHPGTVLLDDLNAMTLEDLKTGGFSPCLTVETSPGNYQAWVRLTTTGPVPYGIVHLALRALSSRYGSDPRAVSPMQPGRVPGFTNRKLKYVAANGQYPFVKLREANPSVIATNGEKLLAEMAGNQLTQPRRPRGASLETPPQAASTVPVPGGVGALLDAVLCAARQRILSEHLRGSRPSTATSESEVDFASVVAALRDGIDRHDIVTWLAMCRPDKNEGYPLRTLLAAERFIAELPSPGH